MAKLKPSLVQLSGEHDGLVHVGSKRYGPHVRKPIARGSKRNEPVLKAQYTRTKFLNQLASEINTVIKANCGAFKSSKFYEELQRRFRREPLDNRFLLLCQLKGMEVNPAYPLNKISSPLIEVNVQKDKIVAGLQVKAHAAAGKHKADCYSYEVLLVTWSKGKKQAAFELQLSEWIDMRGGKPAFDFEFARTANTVHWLLCVRVRLGLKHQVIDVMAADGMQIVGVGSFEKKDMELLKKRQGKVSDNLQVKKDEGVVRVKAKRIG
jgi:hypothetical protein